jgi:hypothetical protein
MPRQQTTLSFAGTKLALQKGKPDPSLAQRLGLPEGTEVQIDPTSILPYRSGTSYCKLKVSIGGNKTGENATTIDFAGPTTQNALGRIVRDVTNAATSQTPRRDVPNTERPPVTAAEIATANSDDDDGIVVAALDAATEGTRRAYTVKEKYAHAVRARVSGNAKAYFEKCKIAEATGKKWLTQFRELRVALAAGRGGDAKLRPICGEYHQLFADTFRFWQRWVYRVYSNWQKAFNLTERRVTGVAQLVPAQADDLIAEFRRRMALMNAVKKITFVVVLDETSTLWTPTSASTIAKVGAKSVVVTKAQEKHCSTALLAACSNGPDAVPHCYPADVIFKAAVGIAWRSRLVTSRRLTN